MNQQGDFMPPLIKSEFKWTTLWKAIKGNLEILLHGIVPHGDSTVATQIFEEIHITQNEDVLLPAAQDLYKETISRIDTLEEKGFKLLTYISAVSAVVIYFLSTNAEGAFKASIVVSLCFLVFAIMISLRCIGIKTQKVMYIDALFTFDTINNPPQAPVPVNKKFLIASLINCAVFNQNVADNTADILKAARIMLSLGIFSTFISTFFYLYESGKKQPEKVTKTIVSFSDSTLIKRFDGHLDSIEAKLLPLQTYPRIFELRSDSIKSQMIKPIIKPREHQEEHVLP